MRLACLFSLVISAMFAQSSSNTIVSHIVTFDINTNREQEVWKGPRHFEAPNWSHDGKYLLVNSAGKLWRIPLAGGAPEPVNTESLTHINNDHGISPDGSLYAISAGEIYVLPAAGGTPRQVTNATPSYFHGWSPDGRWLAYCAERNGNFDLYRIAASGGGTEERLTTSAGYDDGPDYSPDGKWIYFNSDRGGSWDIWRIPAAGAGPNDAKAERITSDDEEDWFPHPSPDGKWIVLISFAKGTKGHPANQNVVIRKMPMSGGKPVEIRKLFGGQGTMNVNSWSPDSSQFAFIWYDLQ